MQFSTMARHLAYAQTLLRSGVVWRRSAAPGLLIALAWFAVATPAAQSGLLVAPGAFATVEGNGNNIYPFGTSGLRYQQVFAASEFASVGGPMVLTGIRFRANAGSSPFSGTLADIQFDLSTTSFSPDGLSAVFADNVGVDNTIVRPRGPLTFSSADTGGPPRAFDIVIPFTTPFHYDPSSGNLLLDIRNFAGGVTSQLDAQITLSDSVSRVYGGVTSASSFGSDTLGLIAQFEFAAPATAAPEPSSLALLCAGLGTFASCCRRRPPPGA